MKLLILLFSSGIFAQVQLSHLIELDEKFTPYALVVEKSTHQLFIYKSEKGEIELLKTYSIASGKIKGDKAVSGDKKTPEGIYFIQSFSSGKQLNDMYGKDGLIYGSGAFPTNYPNFFDRLDNKSGSGIWLHSTDDDERVSKKLDSKGCVVATNSDLKDISQYISLGNTPLIVTQDLHYISERNYLKKKGLLKQFLSSWLSSWLKEDINQYMSHYSKKFFLDRKKGNWYKYRKYKRAVFSNDGAPLINFSNHSIYFHKNRAIVTLTQDYKSRRINDVGRKTLYLLMNDRYEWKIAKEEWSSSLSPFEVGQFNLVKVDGK